jgi:hypothetical protein
MDPICWKKALPLVCCDQAGMKACLDLEANFFVPLSVIDQ